ncbi:scavenger receptor class F member 1-like [Acipenser ruthenus]|uniref:scavenger receptor class F member 1-like n=1 Tax=Acipenser ruthenus TaxID=7906 RepID=UPI0027424588|nr:scavenger receptor class F member 1-like [Acipenser ruthenus]
MRVLPFGLWLWFCFLSCDSQELDPKGRNVCQGESEPAALGCCPGWKQQGTDCPVPLCEGASACGEDEVCVKPGFCRCKHGYYGPNCKTRCPTMYWGPECKEFCACHPHGRCDPVTGQCTCNPNRWGSLCQHACRCGRHGRCDPLHGNCTCEPGWFAPACNKPCQCQPASSSCAPATGRCLCHQGYWGKKCSLLCNCPHSPCDQDTGICQCEAGWWGPLCDRLCDCRHGGVCDPTSGGCVCQPGYQNPTCSERCSAGFYGNQCQNRCGRCKQAQPCSPTDGFCAACEPGWTGTRCDQICPHGYHGDGCKMGCPRCRNGEPCDPTTGNCSHCDPGWIGPRCDSRCPEGLYGAQCRFQCSPCNHGQCDHVTGSCICEPGYQGDSCNATCTGALYGVNCSTPCDCYGDSCHLVTGGCHYRSGGRGALIAGVLIPLLLILLLLTCCCCCCCGGSQHDPKDRLAVADGGPLARMKHHVHGVLGNLSSAIPCFSLGSSTLPRVTVSHHDAEITFNHSFIEPPSAGWVSENSFSSFDTEDGGPVYCLPPKEDISTVAGGEFQEMSSKCNIFPDASAFNEEDVSLPFAIPRTSSIAKAKRPSVSFAEGTKFGTTETPNINSKPKTPWGTPKLSTIQSQLSTVEGEGEETPRGEDSQLYESTETLGANEEQADETASHPRPARRRTMSNAKRNATPQQITEETVSGERGSSETISTVYVTVGKPGCLSKPPAESSKEGSVQAVLRRLGSLQRHKDEASKPRGRGDSISKPPRRKLGARAGLWQQGAADSSTSDESPMKPIRTQVKPLNATGSVARVQEDAAEKEPLIPSSSTLRNGVMMSGEEAEKGLEMVGSQSCDQNPEEGTEQDYPGTASQNDSDHEAPKYENVTIFK